MYSKWFQNTFKEMVFTLSPFYDCIGMVFTGTRDYQAYGILRASHSGKVHDQYRIACRRHIIIYRINGIINFSRVYIGGYAITTWGEYVGNHIISDY